MTLREYQEAHRRTSGTYTAKDALTNGLMGLCGEAGECMDALKKHLYQGHTLDKDAMIKELGDVMWYLSEAADGLGVSLDLIAEKNIEKLKLRYPNGFEVTRSTNRQAETDRETAQRETIKSLVQQAADANGMTFEEAAQTIIDRMGKHEDDLK